MCGEKCEQQYPREFQSVGLRFTTSATTQASCGDVTLTHTNKAKLASNVRRCHVVSVRDVLRVQPHVQLLCVTRLNRGTVRIVTAVSAAAPVLYDSDELQQPPIVSSGTPQVWSPSIPTTVVISGERWVTLCDSRATPVIPCVSVWFHCYGEGACRRLHVPLVSFGQMSKLYPQPQRPHHMHTTVHGCQSRSHHPTGARGMWAYHW